MLPIADHAFEEWLRAPVHCDDPDPRFEIRRVELHEFGEIFDLIDDTFGVERPRSLYEWLYLRNPRGPARTWRVTERESGALVGCTTAWPWSLAWGVRPLQATLVGDEVTARDWQRRGVAEASRGFFTRHPWYPTGIVFGWPNEKSVARLRKRLRGHRILGPMPSTTRDLPAPSRRRDRPRATPPGSPEIEPIRRFDSAWDTVTARCMSWDGFWSPHDAVFLNWRYFDHPTREYVALGGLEGGEPAGYCVVRVGGRRAELMEFAAPAGDGSLAPALLSAAAELAAEAGAARLDFFAPPAWRHWDLFRKTGFRERRSGVYLFIRDALGPETRDLDRWQCLPGDHDDR